VWVLVVAAPLLLAGATTAVAVAVLRSSSDRIRERGLPQKLLIAVVALVPLSWIAIQLAGEEVAGSGNTCADVNDGLAAVFFFSLIFLSAVVGGVAVAASLVTRPDFARTAAAILAAGVVPYVIGIIYFVNALCWTA
jgi:hypothetical protein